jgi:hypothetical protein
MSFPVQEAWTTLPNQVAKAYAEVIIESAGSLNVFGASFLFVSVTPTNATGANSGFGIQPFVYLSDGSAQTNSILLPPSGVGPVFPVDSLPIMLNFAYDQAGGNLWIGQNDVWIGGGDPATGRSPTLTGLSGTVYVAIRTGNGVRASLIGAFNNGEFSYSLPSGFSSWSGQ